MKLTKEQQLKVEANMGLIGKVIKDKVHGISEQGIYTYDDLYQIGSIGLCKAAATDKGGVFSTYAYRLIWNEICDALVYATKRRMTEILSEDERVPEKPCEDKPFELRFEIYDVLDKTKQKASPTVRKGIDALVLMSRGYTAREIGDEIGYAPNQVTAFVTKAKKYLKAQPEIVQLWGELA